MIINEYSRFLQTLISSDVSDDVRKIANLIQQNMEEIVPLTTAQGLRIKKIVALAQRYWNSIDPSIQPLSEQAEKQVCPFTRVKTLKVGPFRGFAKQEDFDLASNIVLLYGPNGTGKSSFCEALEYCLLGNVTEAETKRFHEQRDYLKNAHTRSYTPPVLMPVDGPNMDVPIAVDENLYRFCFVEKNRIDNFSRIAAQTPLKQTELISTLFGLDAFTEFVHNFTDTMDGKYIDVEGVSQKELAQKKQELASYNADLVNVPKALKGLDEEKETYAHTYRDECTFSQMNLELNGTNENGGLISQLEADLAKPTRARRDLTLTDLSKKKQAIESDFQDLKQKKSEKEKVCDKLSFKQLYEAVNKVKEYSAGVCPACQTPLSQVAVDPFSYAENELMKLDFLSKLQESIAQIEEDIRKKCRALVDIIVICCTEMPDGNVLSNYQTINDKQDISAWWDSLFYTLSDELTPWAHLAEQVKKLEDIDKEILQDENRRIEARTKLNRLRGFAAEIVRLKARENAENMRFAKAKEEIAAFETKNALLISMAEAEVNTVAKNTQIKAAYDSFVHELTEYLNRLPAKLVADLGDMVVSLYNSFNRQDADYERLAKVNLPLQQGQRMSVSFQKQPDTFFDALYILSEGHIRCMGLAILGAKNIAENCPLLIFDDPVNAIDDEHRESIRRTLFEDTFFKNKQIILACHGEEFIKDIQNQLPAEEAKQIKTITFLPRESDVDLHIVHCCPPRNYVISARALYSRGEIRDSLDKSRKALEALDNKVWSYLRSHGDARLKIVMVSENSPIELRNLTEQLKIQVEAMNESAKKRSLILEPLKTLLGVDGKSRVWIYLNKATHENENLNEFDWPTVDKIITALEQLDTAVS